MKNKDILKYLENRFPYTLASDFDKGKIGLTIGSANSDVKGIVCSLDLTYEVIKDAITKNANLIITHHPLLFNPISKINPDDEKGKIIYAMIKNNISLISMHTNMDLGVNGVADTLALTYNLKHSNIYANTPDEFIRIGTIDPTTLNDLINKTKEVFHLSGVRYVGKLDKKIEKIAVLGGSGGQESEIMEAVRNNCDCYITGELKHHLGLLAHHYDIALIEVNHGVEQLVFNNLIEDLKKEFSSIKIEYSSYNTDLFKTI